VPKGSVAGTGCTPSTVTVTRPPPWGERDFVCAGGATAGACGQGKVCVAKPVTGATSCIRKAGATACPGDPWTAAVSLYPDAFVDGRGCSACGCTPTGIGCSADVTVYGCSATCTATAPCPAPAAQAIGACADLSAVVGPPNTTNWTAKVTSGPTVTGTCAKTGGSPNGQVQRGTPDLVCCVP
jgi:hypothetical protein